MKKPSTPSRRRAIIFAFRVALIFLLAALPASAQEPPRETVRPPDKNHVVDVNHEIIFHLPTQEKWVALTFDDGPDPRFTPKLLDILKKYGVKATFFCTGEALRKYPEIAQRAVAEGHAFGNHTYTHPILTTVKEGEIVTELSRAREAMIEVTGRDTRLFRPPTGSWNWPVLMAAVDQGYRVILWTVGVENHTAPTPKAMAERVLEKVGPGGVILAHDGRLDRTKTIAAIPLIIEALQKRGYQFATLK